MNLSRRLIAKPGKKFRLSDRDPKDTAGLGKERGREAIGENLRRLADLEYILYAEHKRALLIVLQGMDASGKDGTIRHVMTGLNPQSCKVVSFKEPSTEELSHDYLWRIHKAVPAYGEIAFHEIAVKPPFAEVWKTHHVFDYRSENDLPVRRNYSPATNPAVDKQLRFNVRIATPPRGQDCLAGVGSAYVHRLKAGDKVTAIGPFGGFHIKPGAAEMVYVGGGSGMAPLRSHLSHLFETLNTDRRVSFWYGARSRQEVFYQEYFEDLARQHPNFSFHLALSEPQPEDNWTGPTGYIHEVLAEEYLKDHADPAGVEYYLCGPPVKWRCGLI